MEGRNGGTLKAGGTIGPGRPRKIPDLQTLVNTVMGEEGKDGKTAMEAVWAALRAKAAKGDIRAAELLIKYSYGQPKASVDVTTGGQPIQNSGWLEKLPIDQQVEVIKAFDKSKKDED